MQTQRYIEEIQLEFQEQKKLISEQIGLLEPMASSLRQPAATRIMSAGFLVLLEWCFYFAAIATVALLFFTNKLYPLYLLGEMQVKRTVTDEMGIGNMQNLNWYMRGTLVLIAILLFIIGRNMNSLRKKNVILNASGKSLKSQLSALLKRRAALETLEQRYSDRIPETAPVVLQEVKLKDVPNPGYDGYNPNELPPDRSTTF